MFLNARSSTKPVDTKNILTEIVERVQHTLDEEQRTLSIFFMLKKQFVKLYPGLRQSIAAYLFKKQIVIYLEEIFGFFNLNREFVNCNLLLIFIECRHCRLGHFGFQHALPTLTLLAVPQIIQRSILQYNF